VAISALSVIVQFVRAADPYYNIMTMDGGGIRGMITSECLSKIETEAYKYAKDQTYFKNVPEVYDRFGNRIEKIHMQWLYQMFSGTSTGSLLSTAMSLSSDEVNPKDNLKGFKRPYKWASDATEIYTSGAPDIFRSNAMGGFVKFLYYVAFIAVFGGISYLGGHRCYHR
jgi:hypothetical protein